MIPPRRATYPNKKCLVLVEGKVPSTTNLLQAAGEAFCKQGSESSLLLERGERLP